MAEPETITAARPGAETPCVKLNETALRSEIAFWREMIESRSDALPPEAVDRMHFALALAERRLGELFADLSRDASAKVYHLDRARRKSQ